MTRMTPKPKPPRFVTEYRVRFNTSELFNKIFKSSSGTATAHPGIIKNDLPRAKRLLKSFDSIEREAWIEVKRTPDGEWERLDE